MNCGHYSCVTTHWIHLCATPEPAGRQARAFGQCLELGPDELAVQPAAEAAVGAGDDILAADQVGKAQNALRDQLRMFDDVGGMTDNPRDENLAFREFYLLPHPPLVFMARVGGLDQVGAGA